MDGHGSFQFCGWKCFSYFESLNGICCTICGPNKWYPPRCWKAAIVHALFFSGTGNRRSHFLQHFRIRRSCFLLTPLFKFQFLHCFEHHLGFVSKVIVFYFGRINKPSLTGILFFFFLSSCFLWKSKSKRNRCHFTGLAVCRSRCVSRRSSWNPSSRWNYDPRVPKPMNPWCCGDRQESSQLSA